MLLASGKYSVEEERNIPGGYEIANEIIQVFQFISRISKVIFSGLKPYIAGQECGRICSSSRQTFTPYSDRI